MMRIWVSFFLFGVFGLSPLTGEVIETFRGEWEESRDVKKLYDTPMGAAYRFTLSESFDFRHRSRGVEHEAECTCSQCGKDGDGIRGCLYFNFLKSGKKNRRFVVFDFRIRAFPALAQQKTAEYQFQVLRSGQSSIRRNYRAANGMFRFRSDRFFQFDTIYSRPSKYDEYMTGGVYYNPAFEPHDYRIIIDSWTGSELTVIRNSHRVVRSAVESNFSRKHPLEVRTFGIISQNRGDGRRYRREYFEISRPVVMTFDSPELLEQLPPQNVSSYPYPAYDAIELSRKALSAEQEWRKIRLHDNPDYRYACALGLLYGDAPDPARALELLEGARKENHVLAIYELGVCYYRGYGVAPDHIRADRYLKEAESYGYLQAAALRAQIAWENHRRPLFVVKKRHAEELAKKVQLAYDWQNHAHDLQVLARITGEGPLFFTESSPKLFNYRNYIADPARLVQVINSGYIPGYYQSALLLSQGGKLPVDELKTGAAAGSRECARLLFLMQAKNRKTVSPEAFTALSMLESGDDPAYWILEFAARNPTYPGIPEFLADRDNSYRQPETIWRRRKSAEDQHLLGLLLMMRTYSGERPFGAVPVSREARTLMEQREAAGIEGFELLKKCAEAGFPAAGYLIGRQYVNVDIPHTEPFNERAALSITKGKDYLKKAADSGSVNAQYLLLKLEADETDSRQSLKLRQLLPALNEFCAIGFAPAFMQKGEVLKKLGQSEEAYRVFGDAVKKGEAAAYREMALIAGEAKQDGTARELWAKFIPADRHARTMNPYDIFYPKTGINLTWEFPAPQVVGDWRKYEKDVLDKEDSSRVYSGKN